MPKAPFWIGDTVEENAWDFVWLGDNLLPGIASVECPKSRDIDVQKEKNVDGAFLEDAGYVPAQVVINLRIWTADQWSAYQDMLPDIDPQKPGGLRRPLQITHPEPNARGIDTVYVDKIIPGVPSARSGKTERIECIQWFPKPKPAKKSKQAAAKGGNEPEFDENGQPISDDDISTNVFG